MRSPDVLIIGAGVIGLSIAWSQAQQGARVLVLDPFPGMGCGASGAASGIVLPPIGRRQHTPWGRIQHAAWERWDAWRQALEAASGIALGWTPCGALRFVDHAPRTLGPDQRWLEDGRMLEPCLAEVRPPYGAIATVRGGHVQPLAVLAALHTALRAAGGQVLTTRVHRLEPQHPGQCTDIAVQTVDGQRLRAASIVVAAGADSASLLAPLGIHLPLSRDAGAILHLRQTPRPARVICRGRATVAAKPDGTVVVSGVHWGDVVPQLTLERLAEAWASAADALGAAGVVHQTWTGVRVRGPGGCPLIGRVDGINLAVATGFGSQGYLLAPMVGSLLALPLRADLQRIVAAAAAPLALLTTHAPHPGSHVPGVDPPH